MPDGAAIAPVPDATVDRNSRRILIVGNNGPGSGTALLLDTLAARVGPQARTIHGTPRRGWARLAGTALRLPMQLAALVCADTVVVHTALAPNLPLIAAARVLRRPVTALVWDIYPPCDARPGPWRMLWRIAERAALRAVTRVVVPSADYLLPVRRAGARCASVVPLWPTTPIHPGTPRRADPRIRIAYAGAVDRFRDPVAAFGRLGPVPGLRLHLFGPGVANASDERVIAEGTLQARDLVDRLSGFDYGLVCLAPAHDGPAFPSKAITYVAAGIPILYHGPPQPAFEAFLAVHGLGRRLQLGIHLGADVAVADRALAQAGRDRALRLIDDGMARLASRL